MSDPLFSLCIPTLNRFDDFLHKYLIDYIDYVRRGIIDEIVICDENGNDYDKILNTFTQECESGIIHLHKNDTILGVFENKLKVMSLAKPTNFIAIIDSDNFADDVYFETVKEYIINNNIIVSDKVALSPELTESFDFTEFRSAQFNKNNIQYFSYKKQFLIFLNTGNYVCTPNMFNLIEYKKENVDKTHAGPNDVIYLHALSFQQIPNYTIHVVPSLTYKHVVHEGSIWLETASNPDCVNFYMSTIIPALFMNNKKASPFFNLKFLRI